MVLFWLFRFCSVWYALGIQIQKNFLKNFFYQKCLNCCPEDLSRRSRCRCHFWTFLGRSQDISPRLKERAITNFLVSNTHIWCAKTENITTEMRFLFMFTIDVLRTSQKRHPLDVTLEHLQEVFRAFLQKPKNYKTATSLVSQAHIW